MNKFAIAIAAVALTSTAAEAGLTRIYEDGQLIETVCDTTALWYNSEDGLLKTGVDLDGDGEWDEAVVILPYFSQVIFRPDQGC